MKQDWMFDAPIGEGAPADELLLRAAIRIGCSLVAGAIVAGLYHVTLGRRKSESAAAMPLTLVLLAVLVCTVTLIVNGSVALAFTLGGTLAIVRFRTVVDDTRDTAFVIAAVVVGMGLGTGSSVGMYAVFVGLPVFAVVVLAAFYAVPHGAPAHRIIVRIAQDRDPEQLSRGPFEACKLTPTLLGIETAKQGTAIEAIYGVPRLDSPTILKLFAAFRNVEGVLGVEVKPI